MKATAIERGFRSRAFKFAWRVLPRRQKADVFKKLGSELVLSALGVIPPLLIATLLDNVLPRRDTLALAQLVALGALVYLLIGVFGVLDQWLQSRITEGLGRALRERYFDRIVNLPFAFFVHVRSGGLISRLTVDVRSAQGIIRNGGSVVSDAVGMIATVGVMLWLSPAITLVIFAVVPLVLLADRWFAVRISARSKSRLSAYSAMTAYVTERTNAAGALLVRTAGDSATETTGFRRHSDKVWGTGIAAAVLGRSYYGLLALFAGGGILCVLYFGGLLVINDRISLGALVALAQYAGRSYRPITNIARTRMRILDGAVALDRIRAFLEAPVPTVPSRPAPINGIPTLACDTPFGCPESPEIEFIDVWFRYPHVQSATDDDSLPVITAKDTAWTIKKLNFRADRGSKIAIVGGSGAGKTTIGYMLAGLYPATKGMICLRGIEIGRMDPAELHDRIGLVTQEAFLFSGTLADNICYGVEDATGEEVIAVCRIAGIHDTIEALPDGYGTVVGDRGFRLSGGQKQRIALARALMRGCPVIVLDEATSHLDSATEESIQRSLALARPNRTLVVIAHRLSSIADADSILVFDDGALVEHGKHDDLIEAGGSYARLFAQQRKIPLGSPVAKVKG